MNKKSSDEQHETLSNVVKLRNALPNGSSEKPPPQRPEKEIFSYINTELLSKGPLAVASACPHTSTSRVCWDCYFLAICDAVAQRADCRRAQHGCVIVKDHRVASTGYNGSPSGGPSCLAGECPRGLLSNAECRSLTSYENCIALHAEQNAIAYSSGQDTRGATLYVTGAQCDMCRKLTQAAGIARVVWPTGEEEFCQ